MSTAFNVRVVDGARIPVRAPVRRLTPSERRQSRYLADRAEDDRQRRSYVMALAIRRFKAEQTT